MPERMDLYHYAIAFEKGIDSLASKDKQFCNKPTETGIIETLRLVPRLRNARYPLLKHVSEKNEQQELAARHLSRVEKLKKEPEVNEAFEALRKLVERKEIQHVLRPDVAACEVSICVCAIDGAFC